MGALAALLIFFGLLRDSGPKCPPLWSEVKPILEPAVVADVETSSGKWMRWTSKTLSLKNETTATVTLTSIGRILVEVGTTSDKEAIEHNKRVQECRTFNGEF